MSALPAKRIVCAHFVPDFQKLICASEPVLEFHFLVAADVRRLKFPSKTQAVRQNQSLVTSAATILKQALRGTGQVCAGKGRERHACESVRNGPVAGNHTYWRDAC